MIADSQDIVKSNNLRLTAIAHLTEDKLEILGSRDSANSYLSDDDECEWVAQENRSTFAI